MPNQKVISMLGLARRAGRLSMGHDMAQHALFGHKAKLLLFCSDVSPRLISEFEKTIELHHFKVKVIKTESGNLRHDHQQTFSSDNGEW